MTELNVKCDVQYTDFQIRLEVLKTCESSCHVWTSENLYMWKNLRCIIIVINSKRI